jgi:hypothetical protein
MLCFQEDYKIIILQQRILSLSLILVAVVAAQDRITVAGATATAADAVVVAEEAADISLKEAMVTHI